MKAVVFLALLLVALVAAESPVAPAAPVAAPAPTPATTAAPAPAPVSTPTTKPAAPVAPVKPAPTTTSTKPAPTPKPDAKPSGPSVPKILAAPAPVVRDGVTLYPAQVVDPNAPQHLFLPDGSVVGVPSLPAQDVTEDPEQLVLPPIPTLVPRVHQRALRRVAKSLELLDRAHDAMTAHLNELAVMRSKVQRKLEALRAAHLRHGFAFIPPPDVASVSPVATRALLRKYLLSAVETGAETEQTAEGQEHTETEAQAETEVQAEAQTQAEETDVNPNDIIALIEQDAEEAEAHDADVETETETETEAEAEAEAEAEVEEPSFVEVDAEAETEAEFDAEIEAEAELDAEEQE